ncbi:phosphatase 2C-like domain-containing protein [Hyaloraphidium curvatum]|nr:phosphatase 2C-like domain-containing protein [Hyaloraphidium curvatum]
MQPEDLPVPAAQRPAHGSRSRSPSSSPDPVVTEERVLAQPHTRRRSGKPGTPPSQDSQIPYGGIRLQMPEDSLQDSIVALGHAPDPRKVVGKTAEEEGTFQALDQWISEFDRRLPMPEKFRLTPVALTYEEPGRGSPEESSQPHERAPMQLFVQETQPLPNESEEEFVDASDIMQVDPPPERQPSLDREQHPPSTHSELDEDIVPATPQDTTRPRAEFLRTVEKPKSHSPRIPWIETGKRPTVRHSPSKAKISPDASRPGSARTQADDYRAPPLRSIRYADHVKQGYRMGSRHDPRPIKIHEHMEDAHAIRERMEHKPTGLNYSLFLVADGHGGPDCAKYVAEELPDMIRKELDKVDADEWNQNRIVEAVECAIKTTDKEYLEVIKRRFEKWKKSGADETKKPADDGSTLVLNLVFPDFAEPWSGGEWLLNVNIGDSRTCVLQTQHRARFRFEPTFISEDHHPGHPEKAHHIVHGTAASAIIKVSRPGQGQNLTIPKGLHAQVGTKEEGPKKRHIEALRAGRVVRTEEYLGPHSQAVLLGLNVTQHINCGDAMGDLLFKLDPPVFQCKPDMTWVRLEPDRRYIICMATDGLWDAFKVPTSQFVRQAEEIAGIIQRAMQDEVNRNVFQSASYAGDSLPDEVVQQKLKSFAVGLGELQRNEFKIFTDHTVYDDVTVLLVDVAEAA